MTSHRYDLGTINSIAASAENGDRDAQLILAREYGVGGVLDKDLKKAAFWCGKACEARKR